MECCIDGGVRCGTGRFIVLDDVFIVYESDIRLTVLILGKFCLLYCIGHFEKSLMEKLLKYEHLKYVVCF